MKTPSEPIDRECCVDIVKISELFLTINVFIRGVMVEELIKALKEIDKDLEITPEDDLSFYLTKKKWKRGTFFDINDEDINVTIEEVNRFLNYKSVKGLGFINENYAEFTISIANSFFIDSFQGNDHTGNEGPDEISYEIGNISDDFQKLINIRYVYHNSDPEDVLTTIKIYNIDKALGESYKESNFSDKAIEIAKCILFDLASKYSIFLCLMNIPESDDEGYDPIFDTNEKLEQVNNQTLKKRYDKDLINYYYRAVQMDESEFKYLAFYQVMECIFDEVFLYENIQDIKQVINSNWFSNYRDEDITHIIKIIEQYNKNKNDREKLKLVMDKYLKGNIHNEAYCLANKEIIELLIDMGLLKSENDFKDIQKFSNIIYDYRCKCTHSNRAFPFRTTFDNSSEELSNYISLIKKVSERIIMNYGTDGFRI